MFTSQLPVRYSLNFFFAYNPQLPTCLTQVKKIIATDFIPNLSKHLNYNSTYCDVSTLPVKHGGLIILSPKVEGNDYYFRHNILRKENHSLSM